MTLNKTYAEKAVQLGLLSADKARAVLSRQQELAGRGTKVSVRQILSQANLLNSDQLTKVDQALGIKVVLKSNKPKLPGAGGGPSALKGNLPGKAPTAFDRKPMGRKDPLDDDDSRVDEDDEPKKKGKWKRRFYTFIFLLVVLAVFAAPIAVPTTPGVKDVLAMDNGFGRFFKQWREMSVEYISESESFPAPHVREFLNEQKAQGTFVRDWNHDYPWAIGE